MVSKKCLKRQIRRNSINVFTVFFAVLFIISLFFSISTFAEVSPFKIESATIVEKSDDVLGDITDFNDEEILNNIVFHKLNDSVTYKLVVKNKKDNEITILGISDDNSSDFIEYEYDKHEKEKLNVNSSFDLVIKTTYKTLLTDISKRNQTNTVKFTISYLEDDKVKEDSISINPNTGDNIHLSYILLIISTGGLIVCRVLKKKKSSKVATLVLCILVLCPVIVDASTFTYNVSFKTDISLYDKQIITYVIDGVEHTLINDYDTVIDNLDEPEKDGYAFTKWTYEDGSDFDITKPIKSDIKIIANFEKITNVVILDAHNGKFSDDSSINIIEYYNNRYFENTEYKEPEKAGYRFDGWNTKLDGSGDSYSNEQAVLNNIVSLNTKTLYAQWVKLEATFGTGINVNKKLKSLAGNSSPNYDSSDENIISIQRTNVKPDVTNMTDVNLVSDASSIVPIYAWYDNGIIYYWTEDLDPSLNIDSQLLFANLLFVKYIDVSTFDTSNTKSFGAMFKNCSSLLTLDLSNFDTSSGTTMYGMFDGCSSLTTLDLSNFDISNVTDMYRMFANCSNITALDLSNFGTNKVDRLSYMFFNCTNLTTLNLSNLSTSNVLDMSYMFYHCDRLTKLNLSSFDTSKVTSMSYMFMNCDNLTELNISNFDMRKVVYNSDMLPSNIVTVNATNTKYNNKSMEMYSGKIKLKTINFTNVDTSQVTSMYRAFYNCHDLETINLSDFDTDNVTNMSDMFGGCSSLISLDLSSFNTSQVKNMSYMLRTCVNLTDLNITNFDMRNVLSSDEMLPNNIERINAINTKYNNVSMAIYSGKSKLEQINFTNADTSQVTSMYRVFLGCTSLVSLDLRSFNTNNVTTMQSMFHNCNSLVSINMSSFNTSQVNNMLYMFCGCNSLSSIDLNNFDTSNVTTMFGMFNGCSSLLSLDVSKFNTSNVTNMGLLFDGCSNLTTLNLSNFNTSKVTQMNQMFENCTKLESINISSFNTSSVENMENMFHNCSSLSSIDLSNFNTSNVTSMFAMFENCRSLTVLDLSSFNTSNVSGMSWMLGYCDNLTTIYVSSLFDVSNVQNSGYMFAHSNKIVGGQGTVMNSFYCDKERARIDGGVSNPGYFTDIADKPVNP